MRIIQTAHISLDSSSLRIHTHKTTTQETFVISDGIERTHQGINISMISEHRHFNFLAESLFDFLWCASRGLHRTPALTLGNRTVQNITYLLRSQLIRIRRTWLWLIFLIKSWLKITGNMLINSLFCILLHTTIDGSKHLQSIRINIVWRTVFLEVFIAPAIERIRIPGN